MKCKNCNLNIRTNEIEFIDGLECECKYPISVQDCKHLDGLKCFVGTTKFGGTLIYKFKEDIKFCPFCGDELK